MRSTRSLTTTRFAPSELKRYVAEPNHEHYEVSYPLGGGWVHINLHKEECELARIIATESPFRRMPVDMPPRQILYLDGLRLSAEIAGVAFDRLHDLLTVVTKHRHDLLTGVIEQQDGPLADKAVTAMLDAYSIIDAVHRFRELLQVTPGLKHNSAFK